MNYLTVQKLRKQAAEAEDYIYDPTVPLKDLARFDIERINRYKNRIADGFKQITQATQGQFRPVSGTYEPGREPGAFKPDTNMPVGQKMLDINNQMYNGNPPNYAQYNQDRQLLRDFMRKIKDPHRFDVYRDKIVPMRRFNSIMNKKREAIKTK